jgi:hypothetical protein
MSLDELPADHVLQFADRAVDGRLGEIRRTRRRNAASLVGKRQKGAQLRHGHASLQMIGATGYSLGVRREMTKCCPDPVRHQVAGRGRRHAVRAPLKQRHAELSFELSQPLGQRRLGKTDGTSRRAHAAMLLNGDETSEMAEVQIEGAECHESPF